MTIDDLMKAYAEAQASLRDKVKYAPAEYFERAVIRAVVEALRDETTRRFMGEGCDRYDVEQMLNDILGGAGDQAERVCPPSNDGLVRVDTTRAPAADPSPAVCEWTRLGFKSSCQPNGMPRWLWDRRWNARCDNCGKPIVFKEK